ncbi:ubiquitin carboxyl-terminal hydrolase 47 isoform X2 [Macrosteles quadrilineatus]|uniref:ubiquitin carboxyl-terminal hydrolase 47 isoform X2 n=1 Tax=Macrosteles quadrilineatus TaxID=74068 RepID=UPI0023E0BBF8|nr:ubiquitin carboxyl-terminal hydrolase 47 isoform X2 [Macrosteles quadrilineatus]
MCFQGMVCVVKENNESLCMCVVRDLSQRSEGSLQPITLRVPASTSVREFVQQVANRFNHEPPSVELILSLPTGGEIVLKESSEDTLESSGVRADGSVRNTFVLQTLTTPEPRSNDEELRVGASASPTTFDYSTSTTNTTNTVTTASQESYSAGLIKHDVGYVGLVNQAMTCYLNSLLQALYMTPEFRNALYNWQYDSTINGHQAKCIPYQLQKLFVNLQTSIKTAVETTELTRSFGWDSSEAWQQHDIQELCRVMFDALEQVFKDTNQADLIDRLYQGKMTDYVKCLECGKEKSREDTFLDIPLPVRPFGSTVAYGSVVEALRAFVQPETLDGANQYFCENCNKKCDAHKGLKFTKFPYLLTLHLKRFDFDYNTMHRIKLNDKVTFPELLDLNSFIEQGGGEEVSNSEGLPEELTVSRCDDSSTTDSGSALDDESCQPNQEMTNTADINQDDDEGIDVSGGSSNHVENEKNRRHGLPNGPYVYQLFSIMIHSGSASGGHYYAYIKDFSNGDWFCFNDTSVTRITNDDIAKTFGGGALRGYYSGAYSSSTNAYMLMYRQISSDNCNAVRVEDFPEHIKDLHRELQDKYDMDRRLKERHSEMSTLKVHCHHPTKGLTDAKVYVHNDTSLYEITTEAYNVLKLSGQVDRANCRLVCYNPIQDTIDVSFDEREKETLAEIMATQKIEDLLLEIKDDDEEFEVYHPGCVTVKMHIIDLEKEDVPEGSIPFRSSLTSTVGELKNLIATCDSVDIKPEDIVLVVERYTNYHLLLEDDTQTLQDAGLSSCNRMYVSRGPVEKPFLSSRLYSLIDRFEHVITLHIALPATDPETLARLSIPPLSSNQDSSNKQGGDAVNSQDKVSGAGVTVAGPGGGSKSSLSLPLVVGGGGASGDEDPTTAAATHSDQSTSEDSSLTDSDRTLIGDVQDECLSDGVSPPDEMANPLPAPESPGSGGGGGQDAGYEENWDEDVSSQPRPKQYTYFRAVSYKSRGKKILKVSVDKRMSIDSLKTRLEPFLGVSATCFKLYRNTGNSEYETPRVRQCDSLSSLHNKDQLRVQLGRQLSSDEHKVQVYLLTLNTPQPVKYLCEWIVAKGGTVGQSKKELIEYLNKVQNLNLEYNRCRLRKKNWKCVGRVYQDSQIWVDDITLYSNGDIILQKLDEDEVVTADSQVCLFVRHWHPSTLTLDPFEEIVLNSFSVEELKEKLSQRSNIPLEQVEFAKPSGFFPCDMSVLSIQDIDWNPKVTSLEGWPLQISDDGGVIFYRDSTEELKALTPEERSELTTKETQRLSGSNSTVSSYSPRKERPLKIYLERRPQFVVEADVD